MKKLTDLESVRKFLDNDTPNFWDAVDYLGLTEDSDQAAIDRAVESLVNGAQKDCDIDLDWDATEQYVKNIVDDLKVRMILDTPEKIESYFVYQYAWKSWAKDADITAGCSQSKLDEVAEQMEEFCDEDGQRLDLDACMAFLKSIRQRLENGEEETEHVALVKAILAHLERK